MHLQPLKMLGAVEPNVTAHTQAPCLLQATAKASTLVTSENGDASGAAKSIATVRGRFGAGTAEDKDVVLVLEVAFIWFTTSHHPCPRGPFVQAISQAVASSLATALANCS